MMPDASAARRALRQANRSALFPFDPQTKRINKAVREILEDESQSTVKRCFHIHMIARDLALQYKEMLESMDAEDVLELLEYR